MRSAQHQASRVQSYPTCLLLRARSNTVKQKTADRDGRERPDSTKDAKRVGNNQKIWVSNWESTAEPLDAEPQGPHHERAGQGAPAPPGCRLGSRTTGDRAYRLAGLSRQRKTKAGQESSTICSELAPAGREWGGSQGRRGALGRPAAACGCGEAPGEEGKLRSTQLQPVGVGRLPGEKGSSGAPSCSLWVWGGCGQAGRGASVGLIGAVFSDSSGWSCVGNCKSQGSCPLGSSSPGRCGPDCHRGLASWAGAAEADCWRPCFLGSAAGRGAQSLSLEPSTQQGPSLKSVSSR